MNCRQQNIVWNMFPKSTSLLMPLVLMSNGFWQNSKYRWGSVSKGANWTGPRLTVQQLIVHVLVNNMH